MILFSPDVEYKSIKKITKEKYKTPREIMRNLSHFSYLYGLVLFSLELCVLIEAVNILIMIMIFNKISFISLEILWIIVMFIYTLFYFVYHIYQHKNGMDVIESRIKLYIAIGMSISFIMLLVGENHLFKIFISGTTLEFTWLQYFISTEQKKIKEKAYY